MQSTKVNTTSDLMSIALQAEREAIRRYSKLATCMHNGNNEAAACLFDRMVIEEKEHERLLLEWMMQKDIDVNPDIEPVHWKDPHVSTTYNEEACDPHYSSPYKALAFAVHNEEIAFRFYTHVAAETKNKNVREYAEILAREELGHAALLRAERRIAYHNEHNTNSREPGLDPVAVHNEADLLAAAIHIDQYLVEQMNEISDNIPAITPLKNETKQQIIAHEKELEDKAKDYEIAPGKEITSNLGQLKLHNDYMKNKFSNSGQGLERLWACCDRSFTFYDAIVETADNEAIMLAAQKLTSSALDRVSVLKQIIGE